MKQPPSNFESILVEGALENLGGAALLIDGRQRVLYATPEASRLLGHAVSRGAAAVDAICGNQARPPIADALSQGKAIDTIIPATGTSRANLLRVRTMPLPAERRRHGALILLSDAGQAETTDAELFFGMWTQDPKMKRLFRAIERVAVDDVTVLVRGETGAGKELVAAALHQLSTRPKGPFRAINCAALPSNLLESELFGHARGAFTGAVRDMPGHIQLANRGTLFLDEVAEMPLELQAKLLRVIETRTVIPVGSREPIPVDIRIGSATHRALRKEVAAGRFRADLMFRLRVIPLFLPPLRERIGDVTLLVSQFLIEMNETRRRSIKRVTPAAMHALEQHAWPGNIRELRNVLMYAYAMGEGDLLAAEHLPPELLDLEVATQEGVAVDAPQDAAHRNDEAQAIILALKQSGGRRERTANLLGMSRITLWRRMRDLGITVPLA